MPRGRGVTAPREAIASGAFLAYAEPQTIREFFSRHPELFLDGKYWEDAYATVDYGAPDVTDEARALLKARYDGYVTAEMLPWKPGLPKQVSADMDKILKL